MRTEDAQKEYRDFESALRDADFEFRQKRFADAAPLYAEALEGLKQGRPPGHPDVIYCLQHLGDSLTFSGDYELALEILTELHEIRLRQPGFNNADLIATKLKLAKVHEMLGDLDNANAGYADTMELAEKSLYKGHPVLSLLYFSYSEMVQRSLGDPEFLAVLHHKLEESQDSGGNMVPDTLLDSLHLRGYEPLHMDQMCDEETVEEEAGPAPPLIPPEFWALLGKVGVLAAKLGVAGIIVYGIYLGAMHAWNQYNEQQAHAKALKFAVRYEGKTYESADGDYKLAFLPGGQIDSVISGVHRIEPVEGLPASAVFANSTTAHARLFKEMPDYMQSDDGHVLYMVGTPNRAAVERVRLIAASAQKFYDEHKEFPKELKDLTSVDAKVSDNPVTGNPDEISFVNIDQERDWVPAEASKELETLSKPEMVEGEPALAPGAVHCYTVLGGDKYLEGVQCKGFFIRGCDSQGQFLPAASPGKVFVVEEIEGHETNVAGLRAAREAQKTDPDVKIIKIIPAK